jgi:7,8-didemethyl-8-hydroxy-5-deazariboflavin synthase
MLPIITYSPAYTLVPTYECFNRCTYCNFRADLGTRPAMSLEMADRHLLSLQSTGIIEILILSGEVHPESAARSAWFHRLYAFAELALQRGFLPHTNAGILTYAEMTALKRVNVSMGLMLEQVTPALLETVHRHAPSKVPELRLQQLVWSGELQIPFTTGLLLGLGESMADRASTLTAIADVQSRYGHIQEVILQPYSPGSAEAWGGPGFDLAQLSEVVALARDVLPESIAIQIPPNLVTRPELLLACLAAGARDLGGIGPQDEVNPDYAHPTKAQLDTVLEPAGWQLVERLPVYPQYVDGLGADLRSALSRRQLGMECRSV